MQKFPKFPEIFSGGVKNHQKWCFSSVNSSVHRVCTEGPFWTPGVQKWTLFWVFFWPCKTCLIRVKTLSLVLKKTPGYKNLQKFANFDKIFDNFWQFFVKFFLNFFKFFLNFFKKKIKNKNFFLLKITLFRHNLRKIKKWNFSEIFQKFLLPHRST